MDIPDELSGHGMVVLIPDINDLSEMLGKKRQNKIEIGIPEHNGNPFLCFTAHGITSPICQFNIIFPASAAKGLGLINGLILQKNMLQSH